MLTHLRLHSTKRPAAVFIGLLWAAAQVAHAQDSAPSVEKCPSELGTLAVAEPQSYTMAGLGRYGLGSPSTLLRMIAQEPGCFAVVEHGVAMQNLQQERALAANGQLQADSNMGGGQLQSADFVMTPAVQFSDDTGGIGGTVGGLLGRAGGVLGQLGGLAGGVKFKEAETTLLVADVRSGIQVASAEGKASKMNFSIGGWGSSQASRNNVAGSLPATGTVARQPVSAAMAIASPMAPIQGCSLPSMMIGEFAGQFSGADQGGFSVTIGADGSIDGVGQSSSNASFAISGMASPSSSVVMSSSGRAGAAQFNGIVNPRTGSVIGTWRVVGGPAGRGTFNGARQ